MAGMTINPTIRGSRVGRPAVRTTGPVARRLPPSDDLRLTGRGRVAILLVVSLVAVVVLSLGHSIAFGGADHSGGAATSSVVVQPGQNLWQIAQSVAPQADPRETVIRIRELNGMSGSSVQPGQQLIVPRFA
jgi:hypothetical protein